MHAICMLEHRRPDSMQVRQQMQAAMRCVCGSPVIKVPILSRIRLSRLHFPVREHFFSKKKPMFASVVEPIEELPQSTDFSPVPIPENRYGGRLELRSSIKPSHIRF